ncbi:MAG: indole-3-glycerol phosphate synthase TrpC [Bacillota bacterium]|nr:indole-3-glycerol phosphate synthase TrpC [Bacillota bacterium]
MILDDIVIQKKLQLKEEKSKISIDGWKDRLKRPGLHKTLDFYGSLKRNGSVSIIAEIKKASPSKGLIRENFDPVEISREYNEAEVQAISVLTEKTFFQGSDDYLMRVRQAVPLPLLRKDFIIDLWQVYQSRYLGADAILLIAAILNDEELKKFHIVAGILGMQCLVEVHDRNELERALAVDARIIGINNRNLHTFEEDITTTEKLLNYIPHNKVVVSESGIRTPEDMKYLEELGVDAVLIGETFMRAASIKQKVLEMKAEN